MARSALATLTLLVGWAAFALVDQLHLQPSALRRAEIGGLHEMLTGYDQRLVDARQDLLHLPETDPRLAAAIYSGEAADAALWLQGRIRELLASAGAAATASQTTTTPLIAGHDKVAVTLRTGISEDGLLRFLSELETGTPYLAVEAMTVDAGAGALDVTATIYMLARHAPAA